jgi:hypothetical protein
VKHWSARQNSRVTIELSDRAADNLRFIRDTMAHAGAFTSVSGAAMMGTGALGLAAAIAAPPAILATEPERFLVTWIGVAVLSGIGSSFAIGRKAKRAGQSLVQGPARRFGLAFAPALVAGAVLTYALAQAGQQALLPGMWLTLYGAAVTAGGAFSVRSVPVMGCAFMGLGALCFALPPASQRYVLAAGFGGVHLIFGYHITRNHGG